MPGNTTRMLLLTLLVGVTAVGCVNNPTVPDKGLGVLVGKVIMGPISPVVGAGDSGDAVGVPGVRLVISGMGGQEIKSVITDDKGVYSVSLPAASYRIDMPPLTGGRFTKDLPATVTITEGQETRFDIRIDTGIR